MEKSSRLRRFSYNVIHSFTLKLFLLAVILLAVPLVLYLQFQRAEHAQAVLLHNAADQTGRLIAAMLRPHFEQFRSESPTALSEALAGAALVNTNVKVLVRPAGAKRDAFLYIASVPPLSASYLEQERRELLQSGIFQRLAPTCDRTTDLEVRFINPAGQPEMLTSMTPVHADGNCWIVITSQNAADIAPSPLRLPFWKTPTMPPAALIYLLSAVIVFVLLVQLRRNVSRFSAAARRIRLRGAGADSFRKLNTIPELTGVAEDFDVLVSALTESQAFIRQTAEENSHALKAPLAVIAQSVEPLKRVIPPGDAAAIRSMQLIERSVAKLDALVTSSRDLEQAAAELVYPARRPIDLSAFLMQMAKDYETSLGAQGKHLKTQIAKRVTAYANEDLLEPVIENILENAAGFTPKSGTIEITLEKSGDNVEIHVADQGPGVNPAVLPYVFDRYTSYRVGAMADAGTPFSPEHHQGLGLWIVKRNVEGLGGKVTADNRPGGGFEICVTLKATA